MEARAKATARRLREVAPETSWARRTVRRTWMNEVEMNTISSPSVEAAAKHCSLLTWPIKGLLVASRDHGLIS